MAVSSTGSSTSSNIYSALSAKNKGIGGLATGLDTDSLVEALTSGTVAKITKQNQQRQLLLWKQSSYRAYASALTALQTKYLSYSSSASTNISSNTFFNTYKTSTSSSKVSVKTTTDTTVGSFTIDKVQQLATAETITNKTALSTSLDSATKFTDGQAVNANDFKGKTIKLEVDGNTKTIKLDDALKDAVRNADVNGNGELNLDKFQENLQGLVDKAFGTKNVWSDTAPVLDEQGNQMRDPDTNLLWGAYEKKSIVDISFTGNDGDANRSINIDSDTSRIYVTDDNNPLGFTSGQTNRVNLSTKIGDIDAFKNLAGDVYKININGTEISVNKNETLKNLMTKIDSSAANVRMTYSAYTDEFTITSKVTGAGENITMRDVQGNLMSTLFGAQGGNSIGSNTLILKDNPVSEEKLADTLEGMNLNTLAKDLSKMDLKLTINGVTKTVTADTSAISSTALQNGTFGERDIINAINKGIKNAFGDGETVKFSLNADGQVELSGAATDSFSASAASSGKYDMMNLLGFDEAAGNTVLDLDYKDSIEAANTVEAGFTLAPNQNGVFDMTINGVTKQISISNVSSNTDIAKKLNEAITSAFGKDIASKVSFKMDVADDGTTLTRSLSLDIKDTNMSVSLSQSEDLFGNKTDIFNALGFGGTTVNNDNLGGGGTKLGDLMDGSFNGLDGSNLSGTLTIRGVDKEINLAYNSNTTLQDFMSKINAAFGDGAAKIVNGQLSIGNNEDSVTISDSGNLLTNLFGFEHTGYELENVYEEVLDGNGDPVLDDDNNPTMIQKFDEHGNPVTTPKLDGQGNPITKPVTYTTADQAAEYTLNHKAGQNAEIIVNGQVIPSISNTFSINGLEITVNEVSAAGDAPIKIGVESDPESVVTNLKGWIEDYNALIIMFNTAINEKTVSGYPPLTDEQKSAMTETQIKAWEDESKKGLLRSDSTLRGIVSDLRAALFEKVEAAGISLYDIGITTKAYTNSTEAGTLEITAAGEEKLRQMLETDPDKVRMLFTDSTDGLAKRLNTVIDKAAKTSSTNRGSLLTLAGTESNTGDNTSILGRKISAIDDYISRLQTRLESEYNRYWQKFASLETAIQKMNSQSSWLTQSGG